MRTLITGVTGFVGRHLSRLLLERHNEVSGSSLTRDSASQVPGVQIHVCDLRKEAQVLRLITSVSPERIFHLAALSSVQESFKNPRAVYETNLLGTYNLLESVRTAAPKARVLIVGSSQIYGDATCHLLEDSPLLPTSPYAVSKAAADLLAYQYFKGFGMHVIRARPFNHTGPGQPPSFVCSDFARQAAAINLGLQTPVLSVGNLKVARDFSDVRDVVRAYHALLAKGKPGEAYNVCSGRVTSLEAIIAFCCRLSGRTIKVEVAASRLRRGEIHKMSGSNQKLRRTTGWKPKYNIETTLKDTYTYWRGALIPI